MISSTSHNARQYFLIYLYVAIGCGVFSAIYEYFSHEVYSPFMVWLFAIPFALGSLPSLIFWLWPQLNVGSWWQKTIHAFAVATLTVGSLLQGVVEIYGTTNHLIIYYFWAGAGLLVVSLAVWVSSLCQNRPHNTHKNPRK